MGKNNQYSDDYTGDIGAYQKRHKKIHILMIALCVAGVIAAASATYVLMNPAQTMTKDGIDEMDPNEDFVVVDDAAMEDAIPADEPAAEAVENYDDVPLIEEADGDSNAPADAIPSDDAVMPGGGQDMPAILGRDETEADIAAGEETPDPALTEETVAAGAAVEETTAAETTAPETAVPETTAPEAAVPETTAPETKATEEAAETTTSETESGETVATETTVTETAAADTSADKDKPAEEETTVSETESSGTEDTKEVQTEAAAPEETLEESETETAATEETEAEITGISKPEDAETETVEETQAMESETQAAAIREKSKDEVDVETEGEPLKEEWIDSVGLAVGTGDGWKTVQADDKDTIEVDADQMLRFRVTYTVDPGTLSEDMKTLVYQIPKEVTSVEESYGEIVDADENVLADYAIDQNGTIHVTFTDKVAKQNEAGTKVSCCIEFRTKAANLQ